jgi:hypothetical protein
MYALMSFQMTLSTERLITQVTAKWPLPTMYALMPLQIILLAEWLIAHVTAKLPLLARYSIEFIPNNLQNDKK